MPLFDGAVKVQDEKDHGDKPPVDSAAASNHPADAVAPDAGHQPDAKPAVEHAGLDHAVGDPAADDHEAAAPDALSHYMNDGHLFAHVQDAYSLEVPKFMGSEWKIPNPLGWTKEKPLIGAPNSPFAITLRPTKFMVLELVAAILIAAVFIWLASKIKSGKKPTGKVWNLLESFVVFIRDEVARPTIGTSDADRFLPFLYTMFFFILTLNLFGMLPWLGGATGALAVTLVLALLTFLVVVGSGMKKMGVVQYIKAQVPHMDLPGPLALILVPAIWAIEIFGLFVKHFVLAIRLFANMFAGHLVLAVFLAFIGVVTGTALFYLVTPAVVLFLIPLMMLELFVAFLQAYIFAFLASLFIGSSIHPH